LKQERLGFAFCGSFCTHKKVLAEYLRLAQEYETVIPIVSEAAGGIDTRFGTAENFLRTIEEAAGRKAIRNLHDAEPIGPKGLLDILVIAPCTGNTLSKLSNGVTDSTVTLAAKAHLRNGRPVVLAVASNDALAANAETIGKLLARKNYYFVPFGQDDPVGKPCSLVADMSLIDATVDAALEGRQIQPVLLR
jgi:dipicolinate synthase subunit B